MHEDFVRHEISAAVIRHDITVFLKHKSGKIKEECLLQRRPVISSFMLLLYVDSSRIQNSFQKSV